MLIAVVQTLHLQRLCPIDAGQIYDGNGRVSKMIRTWKVSKGWRTFSFYLYVRQILALPAMSTDTRQHLINNLPAPARPRREPGTDCYLATPGGGAGRGHRNGWPLLFWLPAGGLKMAVLYYSGIAELRRTL